MAAVGMLSAAHQRLLSLMSQQKLEYEPKRGRGSWQLPALAIGLLVSSVALTPVAVDAAWISAGAGEGDYFWFRILFPGPMWAARLTGHDLSGFVDTLMYVELPIYACVIAACLIFGRRAFVVGSVSLIALHCFAYLLL